MKNSLDWSGLIGRHWRMRVAGLLLLAALLPLPRLAALTVTAVTSDNGYPAHQVQWTDSAGLTRTAIMVDQNLAKPPYTGYLRRYSYVVNGATRTCTGTQNPATGGVLEFSGDGFVQNHSANGYGDFSSGNGSGVPGTTTITLVGTNYAMIEYDMPNYEIDGPYYDPVYKNVPTAVQWFFADGRSHPIFAVSQDARQTGGNLGADSRSPYGDMAYDGDGVNAYVGGCSYGDTYKFFTTAANEVTTNSGWDYTAANTIPYAMQWANPATVDAEMGHVATLPILVSDQGLDSQVYNFNNGVYDGNNQFHSIYGDYRSLSQPNGPMIPDEAWALQILNYNLPDRGPTTSKRLAWGANFGRVGGYDGGYYGGSGLPDSAITNFYQHATDPVGNPPYPQYKAEGNPQSGMLLAYSVFVVFGTHTGGYTNGTVGQQVIQMQNVTQCALAATIGSVVAAGPAGVGNATNATITYSPAGYNPTYATWEIAAITNTVNATLAVHTNYPLDHPVFLVDNYTTNTPPASIAVGAGLTNAGVNYFASVDTNRHRLWITVNRVVTNALNLVVRFSLPSSQPAPVVSSLSPASGAVGAAVTITGQNLTNTTTVTFDGVAVSAFNVVSATQITTTVPSGAATGPVAVTTPGGTATSTGNFTVTIPAPAISTFTPSSGPVGTSVAISGANLTGATAVAFNGVAATTFIVNSATQITATVPSGAATGKISVTTPGGAAQSSTSFAVTATSAFITGAFIKGGNLPWLDGQYDHDIGTNEVNGYGCAYNAAHMNKYLADLHSMGITVVRLWLNENKQGLLLDANGNVTNLQSLFLNNLDNIVQLAANNGVTLYLTLNQGDSDWVLNSTKQASYIKYAVTPLATRYKGNAHIFGFDVMNEIDGVVQSDGASWTQARAYVAATVSAIHTADPTRLATCSVGYVPAWPELANLTGLGVDFYDFHDYEDVPTFPSAASLGLDKPVFIGECGQDANDTTYTDAVQSNCMLNFLNRAYSGGYAGVSIWAYQYPGCAYDALPMVNPDGSWRAVCYTIQSWNNQPAPTLTSFSPTSGPPGTTVVITGKNLTNASSVSLNGTAAAFTVNSATQISLTVPAGATTGLLSVTTPGGTVQSTGSFLVQTPAANLPIYVDGLLNGFLDYSWATNVNDANPSPVYSGAYSIRVTAAPYTALSLFHADFSTAPYASLSFWINGGAAGASGLQVLGVTNIATTQYYASIYNLPALAPNTWTQFNIPLSALGVANVTNCQGFWIWPTLAGATTFYVDSVQLNVSTPPTLSVQTPAKPAGSVVIQLSGLPGQTCWLQTSTNLVNWTNLSTNTLVSASLAITNTINPAITREYWRVVVP